LCPDRVGVDWPLSAAAAFFPDYVVHVFSRELMFWFRVAKPWGESAPYDLMVEQDGLIYRVQKSKMRRPKGGAYPCHMPAGKRLEHVLEEIDLWRLI
jgi:hypothetical protein